MNLSEALKAHLPKTSVNGINQCFVERMEVEASACDEMRYTMGSHVLKRLKCTLAQFPWIILLNLHCTLLCHSLLYTANLA